MKSYRNGIAVLVAAGAALVASGCSGEFSIGGETVDSAGEKLIEGEIAEGLGEELDATCPSVSDPDIGTTFTCTAVTPTGEVIMFDGEVDAEDHINVQSTNLINPEGLAALEEAGASVLESQVDFGLSIDCGTKPVILPENNELTCQATDEFGDSAPAIFTITDLETGEFDVFVPPTE